MKAKEAIEQLKDTPQNELFGKLCELFREEGKRRIEFRRHGKKVTTSLVRGVTEEMKEWITKVARSLGLEEKYLQLLLDTEQGSLYVEYEVLDPQILDARKRFQAGILQGKLPIEVLTMKDINAATAMGLASLRKSATEFLAREERNRKFFDKLQDESTE